VHAQIAVACGLPLMPTARCALQAHAKLLRDQLAAFERDLADLNSSVLASAARRQYIAEHTQVQTSRNMLLEAMETAEAGEMPLRRCCWLLSVQAVLPCAWAFMCSLHGNARRVDSAVMSSDRDQALSCRRLPARGEDRCYLSRSSANVSRRPQAAAATPRGVCHKAAGSHPDARGPISHCAHLS